MILINAENIAANKRILLNSGLVSFSNRKLAQAFFDEVAFSFDEYIAIEDRLLKEGRRSTGAIQLSQYEVVSMLVYEFIAPKLGYFLKPGEVMGLVCNGVATFEVSNIDNAIVVDEPNHTSAQFWIAASYNQFILLVYPQEEVEAL